MATDTAGDDAKDATTNLTVPGPLRQRVLAEAARDRRTYKPELLELIEEALDARDKRRKA